LGFWLLASPQAPAGLTVVLLLDVSGSVSHLALPIDSRFAQVFNAFAQGLRPEDRAAVGVVADGVRFGKLTSNVRELAASARDLLQVPDAARLGPSPLWDAIDASITLVSADPAGRPAVVLFSDGKSTGNTHGLDEVTRRAVQLHVAVSAVVEGPSSALLARSLLPLDPADLIDRLAQATGGRRLLDRPTDPRQRNPGPLISIVMDGLHQDAHPAR
jgi:hypothetical protein